MPHRDGTDGSGADAAYLKNSPIEITESKRPSVSPLRPDAGLRAALVRIAAAWRR